MLHERAVTGVDDVVMSANAFSMTTPVELAESALAPIDVDGVRVLLRPVGHWAWPRLSGY